MQLLLTWARRHCKQTLRLENSSTVKLVLLFLVVSCSEHCTILHRMAAPHVCQPAHTTPRTGETAGVQQDWVSPSPAAASGWPRFASACNQAPLRQRQMGADQKANHDHVSAYPVASKHSLQSRTCKQAPLRQRQMGADQKANHDHVSAYPVASKHSSQSRTCNQAPLRQRQMGADQKANHDHVSAYPVASKHSLQSRTCCDSTISEWVSMTYWRRA